MWPVRTPTRRLPEQRPDPHIVGFPAPGKQSAKSCPSCHHLAAHTDCAADCPTCELTAPEEPE